MDLGEMFVSEFVSDVKFAYSGLKFKTQLIWDVNLGCPVLSVQPPSDMMWGKYWYRSGINPQMVLDLRDVVKSIEVYGDMHRYIPALAKYAGFTNIGEKVVAHQSRKYGYTKFGLNRFINGPLDLMSVAFMGKFGKKPMHFFGVLGMIMFIVGFGFSFYLGIDKLFFDRSARLIAQRTEFYIALTAMIMGVQFFLAGFIAEMIGRNSSSRNVYLVDCTVN